MSSNTKFFVVKIIIGTNILTPEKNATYLSFMQVLCQIVFDSL